MVEFPFPLLTLLRLQNYLVPCMSARTFIIPKLQNISWKNFIGELLSLCIERLPNCYSVRLNVYFRSLNPNWSFREYLSHAMPPPSETIFYLLRSIRSEPECHIPDTSRKSLRDTQEIIIQWLQVSYGCNRQIP